jgi:hypothetical protein
MNYKKHYQNLIQKHGLRNKPTNGYYEQHHILPKSLGGDDNPENLVYLTVRCHFIAHWLLWRINRCAKMAYAFNMMCNTFSINHKGRSKNSIAYTEAKKAYSIALSLDNPMFKEEIKQKISGDNHYMKNKEWQEYFSKNRTGHLNPMFGKENPSKWKPIRTPLGEFKNFDEACKSLSLNRSTIRRYIKKSKEGWSYI